MTIQNEHLATPADGGANNIGNCGSDRLHDSSQDEAAVVVEPPKPDDSPAAVSSDESEVNRLRAALDATKLALRIAQREIKRLEPKTDPRYLVADSYLVVDSREEAEAHAKTMAADGEDTVILAEFRLAETVNITTLWAAA